MPRLQRFPGWREQCPWWQSEDTEEEIEIILPAVEEAQDHPDHVEQPSRYHVGLSHGEIRPDKSGGVRMYAPALCLLGWFESGSKHSIAGLPFDNVFKSLPNHFRTTFDPPQDAHWDAVRWNPSKSVSKYSCRPPQQTPFPDAPLNRPWRRCQRYSTALLRRMSSSGLRSTAQQQRGARGEAVT